MHPLVQVSALWNGEAYAGETGDVVRPPNPSSARTLSANQRPPLAPKRTPPPGSRPIAGQHLIVARARPQVRMNMPDADTVVLSGEAGGEACASTRDNSGGNSCASQLAGGSTCLKHLSYKDCDAACGLCECSTAEGTTRGHCSGHGSCQAT